MPRLPALLEAIQASHWARDHCGACLMLAVVPAPEAPPLPVRYPDCADEAAGHSLAFRVTYRLGNEDKEDTTLCKEAH